jgi:hypothetical protein
MAAHPAGRKVTAFFQTVMHVFVNLTRPYRTMKRNKIKADKVALASSLWDSGS